MEPAGTVASGSQLSSVLGQLRLPQPVQGCFPLLPLYPQIADPVDAQVKVVGLVPRTDLSWCNKLNPEMRLFNHLVGPHEDRLWDAETECFCGLEINDELELG